MKTLSPTQIETFARCPRKWWYRWVDGLDTPQTASQTDGEAGHALLAAYFRGQPLPTRAKMLTAVKRAVDAWTLPVPPDPLVEWRLDGTQTAYPVEPNLDTTLKVAGVPVDGFVDLAWPGVVVDHKFVSPVSQIPEGPSLQLSLYAMRLREVYPTATTWRLYHHYVYKSGTSPEGLKSKLVERQFIDPTPLVTRMRDCASIPSRCHLLGACGDYGGCPYQYQCSQSVLSADEEALFT